MTYEGSYLWSLRQQVGSQLLLMPGAQVLVVDDAERILFQRSRDTGLWELPAGAAEPGDSFRTTAARELFEETGLIVEPDELVPFASLSRSDVHTLTYPNGDVLQCFALCFEARRWSGELRAEAGEVLEVGFFAEPPGELHPPTSVVLSLYAAYRASGVFQSS
ncbi:NUDIX domain-containing protein [Kribbella sandramycini]|uniref:8-oxo-dGTP pyrophosphatase MutT (NUDIX family) n=1 Tax=Kribbella sandramycini TaxID=60450 RepID=A0A7Y4L4K3_9ACTN|nr:NUDIX domain-containing protein [Kribbella sandramycini]MBB6571539.1 8-oxo-dGTP pyrophosphatase MutT (NUDIX family) [Kribbella sandramycini]NOL44188.1 NUDIX domain-containing protein [Kribbella sandramycini]